MEPQILALIQSGRHERHSTFRQLQACSHALFRASKGRIQSIHDFVAPEEVSLSAVQPGEKRVVIPGPKNTNEAFTLDAGAADPIDRVRPVLPPHIHILPILTLCLDQCSIWGSWVEFRAGGGYLSGSEVESLPGANRFWGGGTLPA